MRELVNLLIEKNKTISTMESCTGGMLANEITNIENASKIFSFGAVTYSNEQKIKMGIPEEIINKYSVYSEEVASLMAKTISCFANSNYGVGITGKLKKVDENNLTGPNDLVYFTIYDRDNDIYYNDNLIVNKESRIDNKQLVINKIVEKMLKILKNS